MSSKWFEIGHMLHEGQMGSRRQKSFIDAVARVISRVQVTWREEKLTDMLLINVKSVINDYQLLPANLRIPIPEGTLITIRCSVLYNGVTTRQPDRVEGW